MDYIFNFLYQIIDTFLASQDVSLISYGETYALVRVASFLFGIFVFAIPLFLVFKIIRSIFK